MCIRDSIRSNFKILIVLHGNPPLIKVNCGIAKLIIMEGTLSNSNICLLYTSVDAVNFMFGVFKEKIHIMSP